LFLRHPAFRGAGARRVMKEKKVKFIRILDTELDDLVEDIGQLMELYRKKCENGEITNYVCLENIALLENEISCLKGFSRFTQSIELDRFGTLEDLCAHVKEEFRRHLERGLFAHAIEGFVERKIQKVLAYIKT
jgi:hypothetical protein